MSQATSKHHRDRQAGVRNALYLHGWRELGLLISVDVVVTVSGSQVSVIIITACLCHAAARPQPVIWYAMLAGCPQQVAFCLLGQKKSD